MDRKQALEIAVGLSEPSKMPGWSFNIPTAYCVTGGKLRGVKGSVCEFCYADGKNNYAWKTVQDALEKRYAGLKHPQWVDAMVELIGNAPATGKHGQKDLGYFRWHDSGDVQSLQHLEQIAEIAKRLPQIKFWLPTKEFGFVRQYLKAHKQFPDNLTVRVSQPRINQEAPAPRAAQPKFVWSEVFDKDGQPSSAANVCNADKHGHKCGDCRLCWSKDNWSTAYAKHR